MRRSANPSKPVSLHQVEQMIRETETPEHSMSEQIVAKLESRSLPRQKPVFTRRAGVIAASLVAFCVSMTPVMAQAIERLNLLEYINPFAREVKTNPSEKVETIYARGLDGNKSFHTGLIRFDDIEDQAFKSQLQQAWTEIFPQGEKIDDVIVYEYKADTYHIEARNENRSAEFDQGQWTYAKQTIGESQVPGAAKAAADQAFQQIGEFKQGKRSVSQMVLRPDQQPVYKFVYETNKGSVLIDVQQETNQITRVVAFPLSDQLEKLKNKKKYDDLIKQTQAIKLDTLRQEAVKQAKAWMKLDLADYNVSRDEFRFDTLIFTKAGSPSITVLFTSQGAIYGIERRW